MDYIKDHVREGILFRSFIYAKIIIIEVYSIVIQLLYQNAECTSGIQVYVSGQLRSRLRTDEDGRSFQDVRVQANGLFKIVDPKHVATEKDVNAVNSEMKQTTS